MIATVCLTLITALALGLRLWHIGNRSFWVDEGTSVAIARLDWRNFLRLLWRREANMALYYALLRAWMHAGGGEAWIRGLSALFGALAVPALYFAGKEMYGRVVGVVAALLLGVNAYHIRYSQEARGYSLAVLLVILSSYLLLRMLRRPSRAAHCGYVASSALAVYAHFYALLVLLAQWIWLWRVPGSAGQTSVTKRAVRQVLVALAPIAVFVLVTGAGPLAWLQPPGWRELSEFAHALSGGGDNTLLGLYVLCAALGVLAGQRSGRPTGSAVRPAVALVLLWLLLPAALVFLGSLIRPLFLPRFLIISLPALCLLAAVGIAQTRPRVLGAVAGAALVAFAAGSVAAFEHHGLDQPSEDWRAATAYVLGSSSANQGALFYSSQCRMPFDYYAGGAANAPQTAFPAHGPRLSYLDFMGRPAPALLASLPQRFSVLWLVMCHDRTAAGYDGTTQTIRAILGQHYGLGQAAEFPGITVEQYGPARR